MNANNLEIATNPAPNYTFSSKKGDFPSFASKISALEQTASRLSKELASVRSVLNPTNPEESLRVIRLSDQFATLEQKLIDFDEKIANSEKDVEYRIQQTSDQLTARLDGLIDLLKWLSFLIIPGVFGMLLNSFVTLRKEDTK